MAKYTHMWIQQHSQLYMKVVHRLGHDTESESPNLFPNIGSDSRLDDSNVSCGMPILRRDRNVNRPVLAKKSKLHLNYTSTLRKGQENDAVIGKILMLKESNAYKPNKKIAESPELKFWGWEILEVKDPVLWML